MKDKFFFPVQDADFKKSSYSHPGGLISSRCVEVAKKEEGVAIRDSKDPKKQTLFFSHDEWSAFLSGAKEGQFD
jgi:hypothetical protein